jgi:hypothetical protein
MKKHVQILDRRTTKIEKYVDTYIKLPALMLKKNFGECQDPLTIIMED